MSFRNYLIVLLVTFGVLAGVNQMYRTAARLSCWPGGYSQDGWMAYCNSDKYGVYDVDAIWFSAEPEVAAAIAKAQIITLSDSHLQNALSLGGAADWFAKNKVSAYLLGVPVAESGFGELLWKKFKPHPAVVILDASPYFTGNLGTFESSILSDADSRRKQVFDLKVYQSFHKKFCIENAWLCGHNFAYFRSRVDGHWIFPAPDPRIWIGSRSVPTDRNNFPTESIPDEFTPRYPEFLRAAQRLLSLLQMPPECIVITHVPSLESGGDLARYLASSLGVAHIEPVLTGLTTFDESHLTPRSSKLWTDAFLEQLKPVLDACVARASGSEN